MNLWNNFTNGFKIFLFLLGFLILMLSLYYWNPCGNVKPKKSNTYYDYSN